MHTINKANFSNVSQLVMTLNVRIYVLHFFITKKNLAVSKGYIVIQILAKKSEMSVHLVSIEPNRFFY